MRCGESAVSPSRGEGGDLRANRTRVEAASYRDYVIEISCAACGWAAVTSQPVNDVWREHEAGCPAVGGAVRHMPDLPPLPQLLPPVNLCAHRPVRRLIAVTPKGAKRYAVSCELCGRMLA